MLIHFFVTLLRENYFEECKTTNNTWDMLFATYKHLNKYKFHFFGIIAF